MAEQLTGRIFLLVGKPAQVVSMQPDGSDHTVLLPDAGGTPDGIAIDAKQGYIYWTNMGNDYSANDGFIQRMKLDGSDVQTVVKPGETFTPKQLALDLPNQKMYWSDREGMRIMRSGTDGSNLTVLVQTGSTATERADETRHCVGIAIDKENQKIYWTQKGPPNGGKGRIFRAGLELPAGQTPESRYDMETLFDGLPEPIDLELDLESQYLYWTDRGDPPQGNTLNRSKLTAGGVGRPEVLSGGLVEGIGLSRAPALNAIFTSDLGGFVRRFDGPEFRTGRVVATIEGALTGIAYDEAL